MGVVPLEDAKRRAQDARLDLVEVGPNADPPVVRVMDWGKVKIFFRYRQLRRPELGIAILDKVSDAIEGVGEVETRSGLEGRQMTMVLNPIAQD